MNAEVIEKYMDVKDGKITLPHGTQYRILVLPKLETMRPELLAKIKELIEKGAVVMGPAPSRSPSLQNQPAADQQVKAMAAEIWGDVDGVNVKSRKLGKGMILNGMTMEEAFATIDCIPDLNIPEGAPVHYGHRTLDNAEIYFVSNQSDETIVVTPEFRVTGMQPELWAPTTGVIRKLPAYEQKQGATAVPLEMAPYESMFIVFKDKAGAASSTDVAANFPVPAQIADLKGPWTVDFADKVRGPQEPVVFESLTDWSTNADDKIKYYSGTATYKTNFKLDKAVIDRRMKILEAEGILFKMGVHVDVQKLPAGFDAYAICTGTPTARDLSIPGRELKGIYFALDMLAQQNHILDGDTFPKDQLVNARGKRVLVIGGGDTGSDCIGTSIRQGAVSVTQIEIMPQPPIGHNPDTPWPQWPVVLKTTSSHEEGCTRRWSLASTQFIGKNGKVCGVEVEEVEWLPATDGNRPIMKSTGKKEVIEADMVLLAMGFLKPEQPKFAENVFVAGDAAHGASLVVRALADGRRVATEIDRYLEPLKENKK